MRYAGTSAFQRFAAATAVAVSLAALAACGSGDNDRERRDAMSVEESAPTLGEYDSGVLVVPDSVQPGEPFDVQVPDGQERSSDYHLYAQSGDDWVLQQLLSVGLNDTPPSAHAWEPNVESAGVGRGGTGPDRLTTLDDTTSGPHLLCTELAEPPTYTLACTELSISAP